MSTPAAAPAPWLTPEQGQLCLRILASHHQAFATPLLAGEQVLAGQWQHLAQELFASATVVLAHDGGTDPRLTYANAAALRLWERPWAALVGMPSRLTAEPEQRPARAAMLEQARAGQALRGYNGIRISASGRRFQIRNARLWSLLDDGGRACGQAAAFADWYWL